MKTSTFFSNAVTLALLLVVATLAPFKSESQNWLLTGNAATSSNFIGTTNSVPLNFRTNNSNRMVLSPIGRLGIGTATPAFQLDVMGSINADSLYRIRGIQVLSLGRGFINSNIAVGNQALINNTTGFQNSALGAEALRTNTIGNNNTAIGFRALRLNLGGVGNTAIGSQALANNSSGAANTSCGELALMSNTHGNYNTAFGRVALWQNTTGEENTALGFASLTNNTTGWRNTAVGVGANVSANNFSNSTAIGYNASVTASNRVRIGNNAITRISGQVGFSIDSDRRLKQNVSNYELGLDFINKLRPVSYEYTNNPEGGNRQGFIAQEVEEALGKIPFEGLSKPEHEDDFYAINYAAFVVPLVNAVKELSPLVDVVKELSQKVKELEAKLEEANQTSGTLNNRLIDAARTNLSQNEPNPFNTTTRISYNFDRLPSQGRLLIIDMNGRQIQSYTAFGQQGVVEIHKGQLSPGIYTYMLMDGNELVSSKQMIIN